MQNGDMRLANCRTESARFRRMRCETCQDDEAMFSGLKCIKCGQQETPKAHTPYICRGKFKMLQREGLRAKWRAEAEEKRKFLEMCGVKAQ